jgi:hypothetical protein
MSIRKKQLDSLNYESILDIKKENNKQINLVLEILNKSDESYKLLLNDIIFLEKSIMSIKMDISRENGISDPHKQLFDGYLNIFYNKIMSSTGIVISNDIGESTSAIKQINFNLPTPNFKQTIKISYKIPDKEWIFNKPLCDLDNVLFINQKDKIILYVGEILIEINKITKIQKINETIFDNIIEQTLKNLHTLRLIINSNLLLLETSQNFLKRIINQLGISDTKNIKVNRKTEKEFTALTENYTQAEKYNKKNTEYDTSIFTKVTSSENNTTYKQKSKQKLPIKNKNKDIDKCIDELLE